MRIALELLGLVPGRIGGMETYARNLVDGLTAADSPHTFELLVGREAEGLFRPSDRTRVTVVDDDAPMALSRIRYGRSVMQWAAATSGREWDVYHSVLNLPRPAWGAPRMALTLPDLNFEEFPEAWGWARSRFMSAHTRLGVHRARVVFTLSEYSRGCIARRYGIPAARIRVTPCGVDHARFRPPEPSATAPAGAPTRFFFYPANTWPHKNHPALVEAMAILRDRYRIDVPLLLSGATKHGHAALEAAVAARRLGNRIRWLGYVSAGDLVRYYQFATAMVFPSIHEGFGLPLLEAMACGCPVACSATTASGEVAAGAAALFDPADPEEIAAALARIVKDDAYRLALAAAGLTRVAGFTWERTGRETLDGYRLVRAG